MKFIVASKNQKKLTELGRILNPLGISAVTEETLEITLPEVEETGTTFRENALLKAKSACEVSGLPAIADDSGLCVDALNGAPGVFSARYSGECATDDSNNAKLLKELEDTPNGERGAHFVCCICVYLPDGTTIFCEGECHGEIATEKTGEGGFGYDPLFMVNGVSFATLKAEEKDKISHRGQALRLLKTKLEEYFNADK